MPNINFGAVEESTGEFEELEPGLYELTIVDVDVDEQNQREWFVFDVGAGAHKGFYGHDAYYADKPWAHRVMLSYRPKALGMLKHRLHLISDANGGFDAERAFNVAPDEFVGKRFYLAMGLEEYRANNGDVRTKPDWFHAKWITKEQFESSSVQPPELRPLIDEGTGQVDSDSAAYVGAANPAADPFDVPF